MNHSKLVTRLLLLLDAAGWRSHEVTALIAELQSSPIRPSDVEDVIDEIKNFRTHLLRSSRSVYLENIYQVDNMRSLSSEISDTADKIERLLRIEAGMTNEVAVRLLSRELRRLDPSRSSEIPTYSKKSLASWVDRLAKVYPPSEILHAATLLRNKRVHGVEPDWKLRKG